MSRWLLACIGLPLLAAAAPADFSLQEFLGRTWKQERVRFEASPEQVRKATSGRALVADDGTQVPYQLARSSTRTDAIDVLTDLRPFEVRGFRFAAEDAAATTDLVVEETATHVRIANSRTGVALRKNLSAGEGPIAGIRLNSGKWIGESRLASPQGIAGYAIDVVARGPVQAEARCTVKFTNGGSWTLTVRLQAFEPVAVIEESFALGDASAFSLILDRGFDAGFLLYRRGRGTETNANAVGEVARLALPAVGPEPVFVLEPWLHWWERDRQGNWFALYGERGDDLVAVGALEPSLWVAAAGGPPAAAQLALKHEYHGLVLAFPLRQGQRKWLVGAMGKRERPQAYVIKHGDFPLARVKEQVLQWPGPEVLHPRLFATADDLARLRSGFKAQPQALASLSRSALTPNSMDDAITHFLATQSPALGERLAATAMRWMQDAVDMFLDQSALVTMGFAPHHQSKIALAVNLADAVWSTGHLSDVDRQRLSGQVAFLADTVSRPDYWSPERGFGANPNMTTMVASYQVILACMIPTHPNARAWASAGLRELREHQLEAWSDERGGWLEAPHYAMVSYDHMLGAFLAARNAGFEDHVHHPRMKLVAEWLAKISTPPDAAAGGKRHLPAIGNTYVREPTGEFGLLARLWKDADPRFASQMQWMHRQQGSPHAPGIGGFYPTLAGYRRLLLDDSIPEAIPRYGSEWFPKTGVVMRSGFPGERETQVHMIAGDNHSHYDRDSGSITFWGKGRLVSGEFGYTGHGPGSEHSMLVSPRATDAAIMRVVEFRPGAQVDYARGIKERAWERHLLLVKDEDPLGANYLVVHDRNRGNADATWRQWFAARSSDDEVETDVAFLPDAGARPSREEKSLLSWGMENGKYGRVTTTQTAFVVPLAPGAHLTAILVPRMKSEPPAVFTPIAGGRGMIVDTHRGRDYVFASDESFEYADGSVSFHGTLGVIRIRGAKPFVWP